MGQYVSDYGHIEALLLGRGGVESFSDSTRPSAAQVDAMIVQIEAEIDGILSTRGYVVPAPSERDKTMLYRYIVAKVAAMVWRQMHSEDQAPEFIGLWESDYKDFLGRLRRGEQGLISASQGDDAPFFALAKHPNPCRGDYGQK